MSTEFRLPELGENIAKGDLVKVLVSVGDVISKDQAVIELETEKATLEVPSSVGGKVESILVKHGEQVKVGQVILTVADGAQEGVPVAAESRAPAARPAEQPARQAKPAKADRAEAAGGATGHPGGASEQVALSAPKAAGLKAGELVEFRLPELGENIETGDLLKVLVSVGDTINRDQPVLELETDKATVEVPSPVYGKIREIHVKEGEKVKVGQLILTVEDGAQGLAVAREEKKPEASRAAPAAPGPVLVEMPKPEAMPPVSAATPVRAFEEPGGTPSALEELFDLEAPYVRHEPAEAVRLRPLAPAAPSIRRLARELGVDINQVAGSGPGGRISEADVKAHAKRLISQPVARAGAALAAAPLPDFARWGEVERQAMSNVRRKTAEHMSYAWSTVPQVTQYDKADVTTLEELRKHYGKKAEEEGGKLTVTAVALRVVASALKIFPQFAASIDPGRNEIIYKKYFHIGVAVDTDRGLLVPVIRDVDKKNIIELCVELASAAEKARARKLALEDMEGGVFTITNLGGIGGTAFSPIVNAPEVAILGISRGSLEPVLVNGTFQSRMMLPLSLSYDHRLIDGADAARFLRWVAEALEQPFLLPLEG
jgi:pyruvate dehydrogenase E2 component (dihydrolipoamide acetyltransferase)